MSDQVEIGESGAQTLADRRGGRSLDPLDLEIMAQLQEDGRRSFREISDRLGVAPGTVRSRVLQLIDDGVFRVIGVPDPWQMGFNFHATIGIKLDPGNAEQVADILASREEVGWVGLVSSGYDLIFEVTLPDSRSFGRYKEEVLASLPGCRQIDVYEIWSIRKFRYHLTPQLLGMAQERSAR
jgi:Lrp/AsnC family transcriptional regulator for asnA, asnC and gidA